MGLAPVAPFAAVYRLCNHGCQPIPPVTATHWTRLTRRRMELAKTAI